MHRLTLPLLLAVAAVSVAGNDVIIGKDSCRKYDRVPDNSTLNGTVMPSIALWQSILLILAFGLFALLICLIHRVVRTYIYFDAHLLDTFFDGGGDMNFALIACSLVAKWAWSSSASWAASNVTEFGLVGHFWYAAGATIQLLLFAIVAVEIRIKAPGAKTYLQVIKARHGAFAHITLMFFAFLTAVLVCGMVLAEGINVLTALSHGLSREVASIVLAIVIGAFTVVGGVGGAMYVAYFSCLLLFAVSLFYLADVFYDPLDRTNNTFGSAEKVYELVRCGRADADNDRFSLLTFLSRGGMIQGVLLILSSFSPVFVAQTYWQAAVSGKPTHTVWGFLTAGLAWFALPLSAAFAFGMAYWAMTVSAGGPPLAAQDVSRGLLPAFTSQRLLGPTGDYLMFIFTLVAVVTTAAAEVLSASSVVVYDVYMTYISPFNPPSAQGSVRKFKQAQSEEYLEYDRRCLVLKHVVVICISIFLIPVSLAILATGADLPWLFHFMAVVVGSCVLPICLAVTWHRITGHGIVIGSTVGCAVAIISWLSYAASFEGGLVEFHQNTSRPEVFLVGIAVALGSGGLLCIIVSLSCGGCDRDLQEEEEWEKTRQVDNPILPWSVKYAPNLGKRQMAKGRPHFYTIRRAFKWSEITAYIFGVLLAVCFVLVWPACMLMLEVFSLEEFQAWSGMVTGWAGVALIFLALVPMGWEIVQTCRQAYFNRLWAQGISANGSAGLSRLDEEPSEGSTPQTRSNLHNDAYSTKTESEFHSTIGPSDASGDHKERWKTFIHLDP